MSYLKTKIENIFNYTIPVLFLFPLFKESISSFFIILLSLNTLFFVIATKKFRLINIKKNLVFTLPFFIVLVTCFIHFNGAEGFSPVKKTLFFLLFPLIFALLPTAFFSHNKLHLYFTTLKYSCVVLALSFLILFFKYYTIYDFFVVHNGVPRFREFVYNEIPFFKIHPTYYTTIVFFCICFSLENLIIKKKYYEIIFILLFVLITFLLVVKINLVNIFALFVVVVFFRKTISLKLKLSALALFLPLTYFLIHFTPGLEDRVYEMINSFNKPAKDLAFDSTNIRVAISQCDLTLIKENLVTGIGFDSIENRVENCLTEQFQINLPEEGTFMTHNYYLYVLMASGILGFLLFMYYLYRVVLVAVKLNKFLFYLFIGNILIVCLTEDFFYRSYGLFFFSLVFFTFYQHAEYINSSLIKNPTTQK